MLTPELDKQGRALPRLAARARWLGWLAALALAPLVVAQLLFFAIRAAHLLAYPYPLDYGEGPLLTQVQLLRAGTPLWALYADPGAPPYAVVNYPPVYHLVSLGLSRLLDLAGCAPVGDVCSAPLLAGRLVSLLATAGVAAALWALSGRPEASGRRLESEQPPVPAQMWPATLLRLLVVLALLGIPIVREWAAVMRVDMLGVCLGLWGLVLVRRAAYGRSSVIWAAVPLALSLLVKPSLIAAPAAAVLWLLFRSWRQGLRLIAALAAIGGVTVGLLQLASGGWFLTHVVAANANPIDSQLGAEFWHDQLEILWPLFSAGALSAALVLGRGVASRLGRSAEEDGPRAAADLLPISYALFGAVVALGIGKVGAYLNYFLELYAGLIWLAASQVAHLTSHAAATPPANGGRGDIRRPASWLRPFAAGAVCLLVAASLLRYYPLWSETYLKPYGLIEGQNPPRVAFGGYSVWRDLQREREVLAALARINSALAAEVRAAGAPIFTDLPGIAAQAGQLARHQAFEHRQLYDVSLWDQRPLLRDMANGAVPLVALDYLGNWLTPEMIALITHRYAQDGSRGPYDLYRPVDPGPREPLELDFGGGLVLRGVRLSRPGAESYSGGELLAVTLEWQSAPSDGDLPSRAGAARCGLQPAPCDVVLQLLDEGGAAVAESARPLLYGALAPADWGAEPVQHMQPLALPPTLAAGTYTIAAAVRAGDAALAPPQPVAQIEVGELSGRLLGEGGWFVPAPLLEAWARAGGYDGPGDPLMPAVPFEGFTLQCFQRACFRLAGGEVEPLPLGELISMAETGVPAGEARPSEAFQVIWEQYGEAALGPAITPEFIRGDRIVQYTRYARMERPRDGGEARLAHLGEEFLRLPGGVPYRWP